MLNIHYFLIINGLCLNEKNLMLYVLVSERNLIKKLNFRCKLSKYESKRLRYFV